jgi:hypothetical protein
VKSPAACSDKAMRQDQDFSKEIKNIKYDLLFSGCPEQIIDSITNQGDATLLLQAEHNMAR